MRIGYARVSTTDQDTTVQREALAAAGCETIREEQVTGTKLEGRAELQTILAFLHAGDTLVVTRLDRLARSLPDLMTIGAQLERTGANLQVLEQPIDTSTPAGRLFFHMLGAFAEFETGIRKERQAEGIAKAKREGVYTGRKPKADQETRERARKMLGEGKGASEIARALGMHRNAVLRLRE